MSNGHPPPFHEEEEERGAGQQGQGSAEHQQSTAQHQQHAAVQPQQSALPAAQAAAGSAQQSLAGKFDAAEGASQAQQDSWTGESSLPDAGSGVGPTAVGQSVHEGSAGSGEELLSRQHQQESWAAGEEPAEDAWRQEEQQLQYEAGSAEPVQPPLQLDEAKSWGEQAADGWDVSAEVPAGPDSAAHEVLAGGLAAAEGWGSMEESWEPMAVAPEPAPAAEVPPEAADGWGQDSLDELLPPPQQQQEQQAEEQPAQQQFAGGFAGEVPAEQPDVDGASELLAATSLAADSNVQQLQPQLEAQAAVDVAAWEQQVAALQAQLQEQAAVAAAQEHEVAVLQARLEEQAALAAAAKAAADGEQRRSLDAAGEQQALKQVCGWMLLDAVR
jgi:hypothetical protein